MSAGCTAGGALPFNPRPASQLCPPCVHLLPGSVSLWLQTQGMGVAGGSRRAASPSKVPAGSLSLRWPQTAEVPESSRHRQLFPERNGRAPSRPQKTVPPPSETGPRATLAVATSVSGRTGKPGSHCHWLSGLGQVTFPFPGPCFNNACKVVNAWGETILKVPSWSERDPWAWPTLQVHSDCSSGHKLVSTVPDRQLLPGGESRNTQRKAVTPPFCPVPFRPHNQDKGPRSQDKGSGSRMAIEAGL